MGQQVRPAHPLRVLIVEDYEDARESLALLMELRGHVCACAPDGAAAVRAASLFLPDVVLMDVGLPGGIDGYEAARRMRALPGLAGAVFVATTGYGRDADVHRSRAQGFAAHLTKPFDPVELLRLLDRVAEARAAAVN
jgi:two-component system CheB/CheR fusion protein